MLLVPRNEKELLSDILGAIPDGFYQVPRFEIPEMLWEAAFDRRDPVGNLAKLRDWSVRFHLNQVVHNYMPMKYDALGDFQAALREDMFAIHGFDEDMILGWHCDSNLAARLALYRGRGRHAGRQAVRLSLRPHPRRRRQQQGPRHADERPGPLHLERRHALRAGAGRDLGLAGHRDRGDPARPRHSLPALSRPVSTRRSSRRRRRSSRPAWNGSSSTISPTTCRTRCRSSATRS